MNAHEKINYLELPANDLPMVKKFFRQVFGWQFTDYGDHYTAFTDGKIDGGFYQANLTSQTKNGATLIVFYSKNLPATQTKITNANGTITKPTFNFPGGKRFHFQDPTGNEYAVWSDTKNNDA